MTLKLLAFRKRDQDDFDGIAESKVLDWDALDKLINDPAELRINLESEDVWKEFLKRYEWFLQRKQI